MFMRRVGVGAQPRCLFESVNRFLLAIHRIKNASQEKPGEVIVWVMVFVLPKLCFCLYVVPGVFVVLSLDAIAFTAGQLALVSQGDCLLPLGIAFCVLSLADQDVSQSHVSLGKIRIRLHGLSQQKSCSIRRTGSSPSLRFAKKLQRLPRGRG